jgi:hypothetical protein
MTGYQTRIKLRHEIKIKEFQMNSVINFIAAKQINHGITNKFFDSSPK